MCIRDRFYNSQATGTITTSASTLNLKANVKFEPGNDATFETFEPNGWGMVLHNDATDSNHTVNLTLGTTGGDIILQPNTESLTSGFVNYYSPGKNWTLQTSPTSHYLLGVTYGNNLFTAIGGSGTILTSNDGSSWTSRTSGTGNTLQEITFGNSNFVAVGERGTITTSSDGTSSVSYTHLTLPTSDLV